MIQILSLDNLDTWPKHALAFLEERLPFLTAYHNENKGYRDAENYSRQYDEIFYKLRSMLSSCKMTGYHCTRLTDAELHHINSEGLQPQNRQCIDKRIDALSSQGLISPEVAQKLKDRNMADDENRAGMIWFVFFPPKLETKGISYFFQSWGGEALYREHEENELTGPVLRSLGMPCIIESIITLSDDILDKLCLEIVKVFADERGILNHKRREIEGYTIHPIPPKNIRVIRFDDAEFSQLANYPITDGDA